MARTLYNFLFATLRRRLVVGVAVVHAVMMTLFIVDLTIRQRGMLLSRQVEEAAALSQALAVSAAGWIAASDIAGLQELVEAQRLYPEMLFAFLADKEGRVLAGTDRSRQGLYLLDLPHEARRTVLSRTPALADVAVPAMIGAHHVGWARVGIGQKVSGRKLDEITRQGVVYALAAILVGSVIAWFMGRSITSRLYAVQKTINAVRSGNRQARSPVTGDDEAAVLAREFNAMLDAIAKRDAELRASEERYGELIQRIRAAVVVHGADTRVLNSNRLAQQLLGLSDEQMKGRAAIDPSWHFYREDGTVLPMEEYPVNRVLSTGQPLRDCILGVHRSGIEDDVWVLVSGDPTQDDRGAISEVIITFFDITELKRAREEQERLREQLAQSQKMESVGRLAGGVAHDFNNMLGVIIGHSELALDGMDPADPLFGTLHEIQAAAERSAALTRQLLAFARKQTVAPKVLDLNKTVLGMLLMLRRLIGEDVELAWLPGAGVRPVKMDPSQLDQVLANLCVNARDAISGGGRISIETGNVTSSNDCCDSDIDSVPRAYVTLTISDNGAGMDKETRAKIFEPFYTTKGLGKGTGLGLATVYGIVKQNAGFINVYSELGEGTTFRICLPAAFEEEALPARSSNPTAMSKGEETILLVEDEVQLLELTKENLSRLGYTVLAADMPQEALRVAREYPGVIHLLLTDVVMPGMSGEDLRNELVVERPGIKCLFVSGYTADAITDRGILDPDVHFLQKPFSIDALSAKLREVLSAK